MYIIVKHFIQKRLIVVMLKYTDYPSLDGTIGVPGKYELMDQSKIGANLKSSF